MYVLVLLVAFCGLVQTESCRLFDYCGPNGYCKNFTSLQLLSEAAEKCLKADNKSLFNYFKFDSSISVLFVESNVLKLDNNFDLHLWKWIFYNHKLVGKKTNNYFLTIVNIEFGDLSKYSSNYTNLDMKGFEFAEIVLRPARNIKRDQLGCDKSTSSWSKLLKSTTRTLKISSGKYFNYFCPYWLRDVELDLLFFEGINQLQLAKVDSTGYSNLSFSVAALSLYSVKKLLLDQNLLNSKLFGSISSLEISQVSLLSISPTDLFKNIPKLNYLEFSIINLRGFFHSVNGTQWLSYLNYHVHYDLIINSKINESNLQYISNNAMSIEIEAKDHEDVLFLYNWYVFPEEDFCLFRDFPHKQLVVPVVRSYFTINCSCTLAWLLQYYFLFYQNYKFAFLDRYSNDYFSEGFLCATDKLETFQRLVESCNMSDKLNMCITEETQNTHDPYFDLYDLKNGLQTAHLYLLNYLGPVFCFLGLSTNLVIVIVLMHNKLTFKKAKQSPKAEKQILLLNERLYQLMFINAIVNLIYCLMYFLDFTVYCTPTPFYDYDFANRYHFDDHTLENCLVKDIVIGFIASSLKMISNTLLIFISLNRYVLIGKDHAEFIIKLSSIGKRKLLISTGIVSCLLSVIIIFQYMTWSVSKTKISENKNQTLLYSYDYYQSYYYRNLQDPYVVHALGQLGVLITFSVIHDCFSYLIFCIIILIIDVATVTKLKETLAQKSAMTKTADSQGNKHKAEKKSITMVCLNSVINFFLRLPEILSMICFIFFDVNPYIFKILCVMFSRCLSLYDLSNVAYILSLSTPLFFYLGFNNNFHSAFKTLQESFSCKKKSIQNVTNTKTK